MQDQSHFAPGAVIDGRFEVRTVIGVGGFGVVYMAWDRKARCEVAVKTLLPHAIESPDMLERFTREGEICAHLKAPTTARLRAVGALPAEDGAPARPYMVFDLVRGLPLGKLTEVRGPLSVPETAHVVASVLESLSEAHQLGFLHRDLKPDNVLALAPELTLFRPVPESDSLCERLGIPEATDPVWRDVTALRIKVVDFGLGKMLEIENRRVKKLTAAGVAAGTAHYMAPEQASGQGRLDFRADIYGCAMLLFRLLTGREAYEAATALEVTMKHLSEPLPPLPGALDKSAIAVVYRKAGSKKAEERYGSAAEMAWALRCVVDPKLAGAPRPDFGAPPAEVRRGFFSRILGR